MIDVVVATCDRLPLLKRTLGSIWTNTKTGAYRLHVIDDASTTGNQEFLMRLKGIYLLDGLLLRPRRLGISANLRELYGMTASPLVVYCDDDQLAPKVTPDWLSRLLAEMTQRPKLGILSLNNPHGNLDGDKRHRRGTDGAVTFCERSGGSFMMIRRRLLQVLELPDGEKSPVSAMCMKARELGWENGYLTQTYCQHIGAVSARNGWDLSKAIERLAAGMNAETLEPAEEFRG